MYQTTGNTTAIECMHAIRTATNSQLHAIPRHGCGEFVLVADQHDVVSTNCSPVGSDGVYVCDLFAARGAEADVHRGMA